MVAHSVTRLLSIGALYPYLKYIKQYKCNYNKKDRITLKVYINYFYHHHYSYKLMSKCWDSNPNARPSFTLIKEELDTKLSSMTNEVRNLQYIIQCNFLKSYKVFRSQFTKKS